MSRKHSARDEILDAAERVVIRCGAAHLTLDAVAESASVSKGGLLHHFPSKEALIRAMVARHLERVDQEQQTHQAASGETGAVGGLKGFVRSGFRQKDKTQPLSAALLAAGAANPRLLDPVREWHQRHFNEYAAKARHPLRVMALLLAMDGLWLNDLLGITPLNSVQKEDLMREMLALADEAV